MEVTKYYVDPNGRYLGAFEGAEPPDGAIEVPSAPANAAQKWLGSAWQSQAASIPQSVTMRQARLALLQTGMLAQVNTAVAAMPGAAGDAARIEWEFSSTVERHRPLVESLGVALGMTDSQLDDLFTLAATL